MSHLRFQVERLPLPQPDLFMINHPERGLVLIADPRVSDDAIARLIQVCEARADLHPERLLPRDYADIIELVPAQRTTSCTTSRTWQQTLCLRAQARMIHNFG